MRKGRRLDRNGLNVLGESGLQGIERRKKKEDGPSLENIINCIRSISRPQLEVTEEELPLCNVFIAVRGETRRTV